MQTTVKRGIYLIDPKTKEEVCRREYIKKLYVEGSEQYEIPAGNRRAIVNHLKARFDHEVPFQIVFQATAGCDYIVKQPNEQLIKSVGEKAKKAVREQIAEGEKAAELLEKIVSKK